jgi:hypothetical protein
MKKIICPLIIALFVFSSTVVAQNINLPADSVTAFLCKKWEVDHALIGTLKITSIPGTPAMNYEFKPDRTFYVTGDNPSVNGKGTWRYDSTRKLITLLMRGKPNTKIISLQPNELVVFLDAKKPSPNEPVEETKLVYKIKKK